MIRTWGFAKMANAPVSLFVHVAGPSVPRRTLAETQCPVVAWGEHILQGRDYMSTASDADLLRLLKIDASPAEVVIRRHASGYVVTKKP